MNVIPDKKIVVYFAFCSLFILNGRSTSMAEEEWTITDSEGNVHYLYGYDVNYKFVSGVESAIGKRAQQAVMYAMNISKLKPGVFLTSIKPQQYNFLILFHSVLLQDITFSNFILDCLHSKQKIVEEIYDDWLEANVNFPEEDVYNVIQNFSNYKEIGLTSIPPSVKIALIEMRRKYEYFIKACESGDKTFVEWTIRNGIVDITKNGISALNAAWTSEQWEIVRILLDNNQFPIREITPQSMNRRNGRNETLLHFAAETNDSVLVLHLLTSGVNIDAVDANGDTPLHRAVKANRTAIIGILFKGGASISSEEFGHKDTLLHIAAFNGYKEAVEILVKGGFPVEVTNREGLTPLHLAEQTGFAIIMNHLEARCANITGERKVVAELLEWRHKLKDKKVCFTTEKDCRKKYGAESLNLLNSYANISTLLIKKGAKSSISHEIKTTLLPTLMQEKIFQGVRYMFDTGM